MTIIDGRALAEKIKDEIVKEVCALKGARPNLAILLIGGREDSMLYVKLKEAEAKKVGIDTHLYYCPGNISENDILETIDFLNKDDSIDAILVQLPLPDGLDADRIIAAIDPAKDVDGFHPENLKILMSTCSHDHVIPPVFGVVLEMLNGIDCDLTAKKVCVIANSDIFGRGLLKVLECKGARAVLARADDENLSAQTISADILISAVGRKKFIKGSMIKKDAILIDVGIVKEGKRVYGDVDFEDIKDKAAFATPVPGGVGPMTIAMAFKNTLELFKKKRKI
jgi:methylenetetrahydrofolate dehydrogenase (NADP+) / methenyltetrahydrofolate cyclohydrolase